MTTIMLASLAFNILTLLLICRLFWPDIKVWFQKKEPARVPPSQRPIVLKLDEKPSPREFVPTETLTYRDPIPEGYRHISHYEAIDGSRSELMASYYPNGGTRMLLDPQTMQTTVEKIEPDTYVLEGDSKLYPRDEFEMFFRKMKIGMIIPPELINSRVQIRNAEELRRIQKQAEVEAHLAKHGPPPKPPEEDLEPLSEDQFDQFIQSALAENQEEYDLRQARQAESESVASEVQRLTNVLWLNDDPTPEDPEADLKATKRNEQD
jgi:hypothetical protein